MQTIKNLSTLITFEYRSRRFLSWAYESFEILNFLSDPLGHFVLVIQVLGLTYENWVNSRWYCQHYTAIPCLGSGWESYQTNGTVQCIYSGCSLGSLNFWCEYVDQAVWLTYVSKSKFFIFKIDPVWILVTDFKASPVLLIPVNNYRRWKRRPQQI